jgi:hypothetical protein
LFKYQGVDWIGMIFGLASTLCLAKESASASFWHSLWGRMVRLWNSYREHRQHPFQYFGHGVQRPRLVALEKKERRGFVPLNPTSLWLDERGAKFQSLTLFHPA